MFVTKASFLLELVREYKPELEEALMRVATVWDDEASRNKILEVSLGLENIAIDHAVAEGRVAVVPETFGMSVFLTAAQN
jgi:mannose-1-phosphate guanylyltransferase